MENSKIQFSSSRETLSSKLASGPAADAWPPLWFAEQELVIREESVKYADTNHPFDLEERCARFGESAIRFSKRIPRGPGNDRTIDQLVGAATSVGANYCEANESVSKKDFRFTISRCKKEAKESGHFFRMAVTAEPSLSKEARGLYRETRELVLIFATMYRK